jgi:2,3-dihydroxy-p-cumate/2,3-dihydroxybenzoate 3,4-dioxygenase
MISSAPRPLTYAWFAALAVVITRVPICHQVATGDDVMRSFNFPTARQVPMVFGPGRHPTSSARFLYFEGPDGMVFEYSSGVREIADELLYRERQLPFDAKGFCQWGARPQIKEFRN